MNSEEKIQVFDFELSLIQNNDIKHFTKNVISQLPDYFFVIPASTSGKYHPKFALGEGGLVRHTKAAVRIAKELLRLEMFHHFSDREKDDILSALMLHDGQKAGTLGMHTVTEHPILMGNFISNFSDLIPQEDFNIIQGSILHHMGSWTKDFKTGKEVLDKPQNKIENFVHLVDYLASRHIIEVDLEAKLSE